MQIYEKLSCMRGFAWLAVKRANKVKMKCFFGKDPVVYYRRKAAPDSPERV